MFKLFGLKTWFLELTHAKPCRIIWKLSQKVSFGSEICKIESTHTYFEMHFYEKIVFDLQTAFFYVFNVLLGFLAEK